MKKRIIIDLPTEEAQKAWDDMVKMYAKSNNTTEDKIYKPLVNLVWGRGLRSLFVDTINAKIEQEIQCMYG